MLLKILSAAFSIPKAVFDAALSIALSGDACDDFDDWTEGEFRDWASEQGVSNSDIDNAVSTLDRHFKE